MNRFALVASLASVLAVVYLMMRLGSTERELTALKAATEREPAAGAAHHKEVEVAVYMGRMQQYAHKLWASGRANNLPLAKFYIHELEEAMEELEEAGIDDDGVPVSAHMKTYGLSTIAALEEEVKTNGLKDFDAQFALLINTCNSCHGKCGYPHVRMAVPDAFPPGIQDFVTQP